MSEIDRRTIAGPLEAFRQLIREEVADLLAEHAGHRREMIRELKAELSLAKDVLTHREVAHEYLNGEVTPETVIRYIKEEGLPAAKRGRCYFIHKDALKEWLLQGGS